MRPRALVLTLLGLLALAAVPGLAQEPSASLVLFNGFSFRFDAALAVNVNIVQYPGDPVDQEQPGGPEPRHTQFLLYTEPPAPAGIFDSRANIRLYRSADLSAYPEYQATADTLRRLLTDRPDLKAFAAVSDNLGDMTLPFLPALPATQVIRAQAQYIRTPAVNGVRYVTVYRQDVAPLRSTDFVYTFQGFTADGSLYIAATVPLVVDLFPAEAPADLDYDRFAATFMGYLMTSAAALNNAPPASFAPRLEALDALVNTFAWSG